jgi:hypothetical protein
MISADNITAKYPMNFGISCVSPVLY